MTCKVLLQTPQLFCGSVSGSGLTFIPAINGVKHQVYWQWTDKNYSISDHASLNQYKTRQNILGSKIWSPNAIPLRTLYDFEDSMKPSLRPLKAKDLIDAWQRASVGVKKS